MKVLIYSSNYIIGEAIKHICRLKEGGQWDVCYVSDIQKILFFAKSEKPDYIIMNVAPRKSCYVIYTIRQYLPSIPFIFVQDRFLFSDYISADFFGGIVLSDYEALLAMESKLTPYDLINNEMFAGPFFSGGVIKHEIKSNELWLSQERLRDEMNKWLRVRLEGIITSHKCLFFLRGILDEKRLCILKIRKDINFNKQYHYRSMVMKAIGISSFTRDFISSLRF